MIYLYINLFLFFFSSRRRHTRLQGDWSSDVCSSDLSRRPAPAPAWLLRPRALASTVPASAAPRAQRPPPQVQAAPAAAAPAPAHRARWSAAACPGWRSPPGPRAPARKDRKSVVEGKRVDL